MLEKLEQDRQSDAEGDANCRWFEKGAPTCVHVPFLCFPVDMELKVGVAFDVAYQAQDKEEGNKSTNTAEVRKLSWAHDTLLKQQVILYTLY